MPSSHRWAQTATPQSIAGRGHRSVPRAKKSLNPKPKTRSRAGCWPCRARKIKCGEEKSSCNNCTNAGKACNYTVRLNWEGRTRKTNAESDETRIVGSSGDLLSHPEPSNSLISSRGVEFGIQCQHLNQTHPECALSQRPPLQSENVEEEWQSSGSQIYGYDLGLEDHDIPQNDDMSAIAPEMSVIERDRLCRDNGLKRTTNCPMALEPGGYYSTTVPVRISHTLQPIPKELLNNPMNLLYFHHFINHTARLMTSHDCPENVFRSVLPQMALHSPPLMHLILIYSACHRARILNHPEPKYRISTWMSDVLPSLREALSNPSFLDTSDPQDPSLIAPLLTALMFASLEIISPAIFPLLISWRVHLQTARQLIMVKGGLSRLARQPDGSRNRAVLLVSRWFAYLDVMGALSGGIGAELLLGAYDDDGGGLWLVNRENEEELYGVDCALGFSGRCLPLLARVAELAGQCDQMRIDAATGKIVPDWKPHENIRQRAESLIQEICDSANMQLGCTHTSQRSSLREDESMMGQIYSTNKIYHWAAIIVIAKRVLAQLPDAPIVQEMVQRIILHLKGQQFGRPMGWCPVFPVFVAGCEAVTADDQALFDRCISQIQRYGLHHVDASPIMHKVWETGDPWETMIEHQFLA
ncbi:fungal-specific transcription factor domain-containing protein [Acrodontium crateriforme]|uniref:Fungal-specific transcription factor domain-containing protein n=1 Tax=Acrodontium crateriforme TaxID=150365 RepID=A0AAQ3RBM5_9PEZI|nr:fungal-specific transcription factor domain-containing protein [Acrodontium crateriforme]